jgi:putative tryptophan/tyrosine transport system substrate-binding protein
MPRRTIALLITLPLGLLVAPLAADVPSVGKGHRIGFLEASIAASTAGLLEVFRQGLREHGWIEGQNIMLEYREGDAARLADLAAELVRLQVDVLVAPTTRAARLAQQATQTIPIVMLSGDPVGTGLVASLARPAESVTGVSLFQPELAGKRLELLKELVPGLTRVAVLWEAEGPSNLLEFKAIEAVAPSCPWSSP